MPKIMPRGSPKSSGDGTLTLPEAMEVKPEPFDQNSFPQLERDNYSMWAMQMRVQLQFMEVWGAIDKAGPEYAEGGAEYRKDRGALTAIYRAVPKTMLPTLAGKDSAKEDWEAIKKSHLGHDRVREANLQTYKKLFEELKMAESETVDEFATRVTSLVSRIRGLGKKLDEIEVMRKFLRAAPTRYMQLVTTIEQCIDLKTLSTEDLVGRYKAYDERVRSTFGNP